jgi:hypothetical protein
MNTNWKSRLTMQNVQREGMNAMWVAVGVLGSTLIDRGVQKLIEKFVPNPPDYIKYVKPLGPILTGFGLSLFAKEGAEGNPFRLVGYGVTGAGVISGFRLMPWFDKLLSDTEPDPQKPVAGLNGLLGLALGEFGASDNIRQINTADAEAISLELPDLGRAKAESVYQTNQPQSTLEDFEEVIAEVI